MEVPTMEVLSASSTEERVESTQEEPVASTSRKRPRLSSILSGSVGSGADRIDESFISSISAPHKRPRVSSFLGEPIGTGSGRLLRTRSLYDDESDLSVIFSRARHSRPISGSSSFTAGSRAASPLPIGELPSASHVHISRSGVALMRSASSSSLHAPSPIQTYSEVSAKHFLRNTKVTIDYSAPSPDPEITSHLLSCSAENVLFFTRGNRVHYKNISTSQEVGQLCKIQESRGDLRAIQCNGTDHPDLIALGTSKGNIQIWDIKTKKIAMHWSTKGVSAMCWNGPVLSVGGLKGSIKHYDTRVIPSTKMKEQAPKVTRHGARITSLSWNVDGKFLASGDATGTVYCWELGQRVPLDVGEFIQRRKKIQHAGMVSAIAWCPWLPRLLATACTKGIVQLWNINATTPSSNATTPGRLELGSPITGMHFSPHCKEILTTHGASIPGVELEWPRVSMANSIAVHSYPSLRHVTTLPISDKPIGDSVLNTHGTKIVFAVPEETKLNVCDVWSKRKEIKKQPSFMSSSIR